MKFVFPEIDFIFDTECDKINTLIIENPVLFRSLLQDITDQLSGLDGKAVLSENSKLLNIAKKLELLDRFIPFDLNSKAINSKIVADLELKAVSDEFYSATVETVGRMETLLNNLAFDYMCDIDFTKVSIGAFIKAAGVEVRSAQSGLAEKIIDYFELVTEFIGPKMFVTVNLRCYISDKDAELFIKTAISHGYHLLMIESFEHERLSCEKRLVADSDLCLIC